MTATSDGTRSTDVWRKQHEVQYDDLNTALFLYYDWIFPNSPETWRDKEVLDAGSGPGVQIRMMAEVARSVVAVDLEAISVSEQTTSDLRDRITYVCDDISTMDLGRKFDVVNCVGTIHHTDDPSITFRNLQRHLKPGGRMVIWAYAEEGNGLMRRVVEPLRQKLLMHASHRLIYGLSYTLNIMIWPVVNTIYRLPLSSLPYHAYFKNYRKMPFRRNLMNIYDKLNAPQQHFIPRATIEEWFRPDQFEDIHISHYAGVSWRASGTLRADTSSP
jgi:SAM-dependent methyltransferase